MVKEDGNHKFPWGNIYLAPTYLENKRIWLRKAEQWKWALLKELPILKTQGIEQRRSK